MAIDEVIERRRREVLELALKGVNIDALAKQFNISPSTINQDLKYQRSKIWDRIAKGEVNGRVAELAESARQRNQKIWQILTAANTTNKEILGAISLLQKEEELRIKREQMVGLLPKEDTPLIAIQNNESKEVIFNIITPAKEERAIDDKTRDNVETNEEAVACIPIPRG